jgi:prepilin-type N-terminal cleavage/methylation domain-containing protein/prepilin-type processing-associated H-X9-DG protein
MKEKEMKKKGFTLVELLVVIAIIALLMGILMPALARVRQIAYRLYCGTNLSGIGKAMLIYANDYDDELPRAGLSGGGWDAPINNYFHTDLATAFKDGASISSCFYLLIKYAEVTPQSFLCKGDSGVTEYEGGGLELVNLHDFGGTDTQKHCSYSYHNPFVSAGGYSLTSSSDPGMAVAADPNPWQETFEGNGRMDNWQNDFDPLSSNREKIKAGNAETHQYDGQNVLFVDGHTKFEKESMCGVDSDNIYTIWSSTNPDDVGRQKGDLPGDGGSIVGVGRNDSLLVTDGPKAKVTSTR